MEQDALTTVCSCVSQLLALNLSTEIYVISFIISKLILKCNSKIGHDLSIPVLGSLENDFLDLNLIARSHFFCIFEILRCEKY